MVEVLKDLRARERTRIPVHPCGAAAAANDTSDPVMMAIVQRGSAIDVIYPATLLATVVCHLRVPLRSL